MSVVAFVIERRLLKALKTGSVKPAARTAAGPDEPGIVPGDESQPRAEFSPDLAIQNTVKRASGWTSVA